MKNYFIGVDVSKLKLDICLRHNDELIKELELANQLTVIRKFFKGLLKATDTNDYLVCAEYTGQYTYPLACVCSELGIDLWLENPTEIKFSSGMQRGKNDKVDARRIAAYAQRFEDRAKLYSLPEKKIRVLKQLISERDLYMCDKSKYKGQLSDQRHYMATEDYRKKSSRMRRLIKALEASIAEIEAEMQRQLYEDPVLSRQYELLCSVDGIGDRTAIKMIVETNAFKDFSNPRKFCCHAGVAPFSYTSGSSQKSRNKVSHRADKSIKKLLHLAALSIIKNNGELHDYYLRKVDEGKNKMSVINAVRAKLVLRMFAVIRNNQPYQKNYQNIFA